MEATGVSPLLGPRFHAEAPLLSPARPRARFFNWDARRVNKDELRAEMRGALRALDEKARAPASERICCRIEQHPAWRNSKVVCAFVPLASEPRIAPLWRDESARVFCFPRIGGAEIELVRIDDCTRLEGAGWKLEERDFSAAPRVATSEIDVILVPGLAFTREGLRLGRGGGFYDRLLARCALRTVKLGVCFAAQLRDDLPTEAHDQRVDEIIFDLGD